VAVPLNWVWLPKGVCVPKGFCPGGKYGEFGVGRYLGRIPVAVA